MWAADRAQNSARNEMIHLLLKEHKLIWSLWCPMCKATVPSDSSEGCTFKTFAPAVIAHAWNSSTWQKTSSLKKAWATHIKEKKRKKRKEKKRGREEGRKGKKRKWVGQLGKPTHSLRHFTKGLLFCETKSSKSMTKVWRSLQKG